MLEYNSITLGIDEKGVYMSKIKGIALFSIKKYLEKRYSKDDMELLKNEISESAFKTLMESDLQTFYPLDDFIAINKAIVKLFGANDIDILKKMGRSSADEALQSLFKEFFKFGRPDFILKKVSVLYNEYFDEGKMKLLEIDDRQAVVELSDFPMNNSMKYICTRIEGWLERALEICAGKKATIDHSTCIAKGDNTCRFHCKW